VQQVEQLEVELCESHMQGARLLVWSGDMYYTTVCLLGLAEAGCDLAEQVVKMWLWYAA
jgi:hypothetical protein